jgi:hypothetical protein
VRAIFLENTMNGCHCGGCRDCLRAQGCRDCLRAQGCDEGGDDITAEELQIVREMINDAELAHEQGDDREARAILLKVIAALQEFADEVPG